MRVYSQTRVCIYHNSTHSLEPGLSEFQDRTGQAIQDQPSFPKLGSVISKPGHSVIQDQQARPLSSDQQQVGSAGQSSRIRPVGQNQVRPVKIRPSGQSGAAIHVWLGRVQLIRSCIKGIGKYKQRRSQRMHT